MSAPFPDWNVLDVRDLQAREDAMAREMELEDREREMEAVEHKLPFHPREDN